MKIKNINQIAGDHCIQIGEAGNVQIGNLSPSTIGSAPHLPPLIIGREEALQNLRIRLGATRTISESPSVQILTAVRGWPGIGKTTLAAALAHDPQILEAFPDGVLWVSLGPEPDLMSHLVTWGNALGTDSLSLAQSVEEASARLAAILRNQRMFLIIDDVWQVEHAHPFIVGSKGCAIVITTRFNSVAQELAPTADSIYKLNVLSPGKSIELLSYLAPSVVTQYTDQCLELAKELDGLPLALQVAGRLLNVEIDYGFSVKELLAELREGSRILEAKAPADLSDLVSQTTPTVAVLLERSTSRLDQRTRECFACLGAFAASPATFSLYGMKAVWNVDDPNPIARSLLERGLLECIPQIGRYQIHSLLALHAKALLNQC
jgi:hypothetical protein